LSEYEISREPLNGFAPNSHGRRVWSLARTSLKVKVKGQGHHKQRRHFSSLSATCVRFMFGKTPLASSKVSEGVCVCVFVCGEGLTTVVESSQSSVVLRHLAPDELYQVCVQSSSSVGQSNFTQPIARHVLRDGDYAQHFCRATRCRCERVTFCRYLVCLFAHLLVFWPVL